MNKITVICPLDEGQTLSERMEHVLNYALHWGSREVERITKASELQSITGGTLLFAVYVSDTGINIEYSRMLDRIRREGDFFPECTGAVLVGGGSDLYTKAIGREMVRYGEPGGLYVYRAAAGGRDGLAEELPDSGESAQDGSDGSISSGGTQFD